MECEGFVVIVTGGRDMFCMVFFRFFVAMRSDYGLAPMVTDHLVTGYLAHALAMRSG